VGLRRSLPWIVCALLAACCAPALVDAAPGEPAASIVVRDNQFQDGGSSDTTDNVVEVLPGSTVAFSYPKSQIEGSAHNVVFDPGSAPASCEQTAGLVIGPAPPLPSFPLPEGWAGTCRFDALGTYTFACGVHEDMRGAVEVVEALTPTPTATASPTPTPTVGSSSTSPPAPPPAAPRSISRARIASAVFKRSKRRVTFKGTIAKGATGVVKLDLSYRVGKSTRRKSASARIVAGRFSGVIRLRAAHAKRARRLTLTVAYPGDAGFLPSSKLAKVRITR
jgi:plastocyanin